MKNFDFDEWANLYKRDPRAFEARRQAMLAIELAKGGKSAEQARIALRRLEKQVAGQSDTDRIQTSLMWMIASLRQLNQRMDQLAAEMSTVHRRPDSTNGQQPG